MRLGWQAAPFALLISLVAMLSKVLVYDRMLTQVFW